MTDPSFQQKLPTMSMESYTRAEPQAGYIHEVYTTCQGSDPEETTCTVAEKSVLRRMGRGGRFSIVTVHNHRSSFRGPPRGAVPAQTVLDTLQAPGLLSAGGNYNLYKENFFRWDQGEPRTQGRLYKYPVGANSLTAMHIPVPTIQRPYWERQTATDGSFISMGPSLFDPLDMPKTIDVRRASRWDRSFAYTSEHTDTDTRMALSPMYQSFERADEALGSLLTLLKRNIPTTLSMTSEIESALETSKILLVAYKGKTFTAGGCADQAISNALHALPDLDSDDEYKVTFVKSMPHDFRVRAESSLVPGTWSHCREKNERSAKVVLMDGRACDLAYTCSNRNDGIDLNEWRELILEYMSSKSISVDQIDTFWNSDGSTNIVQYLACDDGSVRALAKGELQGDLLPVLAKDVPVHLQRECPNYYLLRTENDDVDDRAEVFDKEFVGCVAEAPEFDTPSGAPPWIDKCVADDGQYLTVSLQAESRLINWSAATRVIPVCRLASVSAASTRWELGGNDIVSD